MPSKINFRVPENKFEIYKPINPATARFTEYVFLSVPIGV
jgi:hypothetical protein